MEKNKKNKKCIIYTRVSSKEQAKENYSIETQTKFCEEFAQRHGFNEIKLMGGIAESAKDEYRKTYKAMLAYALDKKNKVDALIVYSIDRFSRYLPTAAPDIERLKKNNITLYAVHEGINSIDAMGVLLMHFKLSNSQFENSLRSSRSKDGVKSRVLSGEYPFATPPIGYNKDRNKRLVINEDGELIGKAFKMLLDGYTMTQVMNDIAKYGLKIKINRWGEIVRNPIYAGLIISKANENKPVKGVHEPIVSEKGFKKLQDVLANKCKARIKETDTIEFLPLKTFLKCPNCGGKLTGHINRQKQSNPAYYKCNTVKCRFSASAKKANTYFDNILSLVELNEVFKDEVKNIFEESFESIFQDIISTRNRLIKAISTKETMLNNLYDDKYSEKIRQTQFETLFQRYTKEKEDMEKQLSYLIAEIPDKATFIESCISDLANIKDIWDQAEYMDKQQLFNVLFAKNPSVINENQNISLSDIKFNHAFKINYFNRLKLGRG